MKVSPLSHKEFLTTLLQTSKEDIRRAKVVAKSKRLIPTGFDTKPHVMDGSIASDNVLIRDSAYFQSILSATDEKCRGAEMEAAGFVLACQKEKFDGK